MKLKLKTRFVIWGGKHKCSETLLQNGQNWLFSFSLAFFRLWRSSGTPTSSTTSSAIWSRDVFGSSWNTWREDHSRMSSRKRSWKKDKSPRSVERYVFEEKQTLFHILAEDKKKLAAQPALSQFESFEIRRLAANFIRFRSDVQHILKAPKLWKGRSGSIARLEEKIFHPYFRSWKAYHTFTRRGFFIETSNPIIFSSGLTAGSRSRISVSVPMSKGTKSGTPWWERPTGWHRKLLAGNITVNDLQ